MLDISPVNEIVSGHSVKVQVKLDENATDREILNSLDNACREWGTVQKIEMAVRLLVGRILIAVRARELYKEEHGTFRDFLVYIEHHYGIKKSSAWDAINIVEGLPTISTERAEKIGPTNLLVVARAVKAVPKYRRELLAERLLTEADRRPPVDEFRERLENAKLLRTGRERRRLARIVLEVPIAVANEWRELVGTRNSAQVFAELVRGSARKPVDRAIAV